jgi:hypothetical protein
MEHGYEYAALDLGRYSQATLKDRIRAFFLDDIGRIVTRDQLVQLAGGRENWHQRLSELRTDEGYTILSWRNQGNLRVSEYLMPTAERRPMAARRVRPTVQVWHEVLSRARHACEWTEADGIHCGLKNGDLDPVGGGTVKLTPDHKTPHSLNPASDPSDPEQWQALCGRHQVVKKSYWDHLTGKLNTYAIVQGAPEAEKLRIYQFLKKYFGDV